MLQASISGQNDSLQLLETADRLDCYSNICTKRLTAYTLSSPPNTAIVPEENAQEIINSSEVPAWQESVQTQTQAARPEEVALFLHSTLLDSPDTDFPPTQIDHPPLPPSPIPHITIPRSPAMLSAAEPPPQRRKVGGEDAVMEGASSAEEEIGNEEERKIVRMWEKRMIKCSKVAAKSVASEILPPTCHPVGCCTHQGGSRSGGSQGQWGN